MARLHVVGVRHHSPACARLVAHTIATVRPRFVLIEGPSDMNDRIDELHLGHTLPIAIYSYAHGTRSHASWSPFCAYSPEWVALQSGRAVGADTRFIDLPAWDAAFLEVENRYSDRHSWASARMLLLCERLGIEDTDALWDHLFEQPLPLDQLRERLATYFVELREGDDALERDILREAYMQRWIGWALTQGDVVVVCGGYHAPVLARSTPGGAEPAVPVARELSRTGSYLVPYSFRRLDAFVGYESGMPSPAFYQRAWDDGAAAAGEHMLWSAITHLREKRQHVSPADAIAALTLARGIATLRGHAELGRVDVLDGLAAAVVKDALATPLPWTLRGTLQRGTDPLIVALVAAFSGDRIGTLAAGTPHPPLVADAFAALAAVGIVLDRTERPFVVSLAADLPRSRVLHRLRVLGIPGFTLIRAPSFDRERTRLEEEWRIAHVLDAEAALIEAAAYGATLESAAAAKLEEALRGGRGIAVVARTLRTAALVGIESLTLRLATEARAAAALEPSFVDLGAGLATLLGLHEHDVLFGARGAPILRDTIVAAFDRGLWLLDTLADAGKPEIEAAVALRDACRTKIPVDRARAEAVLARRAADAPASLRGAALGFLWSLGASVDPATALRGATSPGDFLAGLFALAREEVLHAPAILEVVDGLVRAMTREEFLHEIPALRLAFSWFPPREKERIAERILGLGTGARAFVSLDVAPEATIAGLALDATVDRLAATYGLDAS